MKARPKRENYGIGKFGDLYYLERLERYCTYLENNKRPLEQEIKKLSDKIIKLERTIEAFKVVGITIELAHKIKESINK